MLFALAAALPMVVFRPGNEARNTNPCHAEHIRSNLSSCGSQSTEVMWK